MVVFSLLNFKLIVISGNSRRSAGEAERLRSEQSTVLGRFTGGVRDHRIVVAVHVSVQFSGVHQLQQPTATTATNSEQTSASDTAANVQNNPANKYKSTFSCPATINCCYQSTTTINAIYETEQ